MEVVFTSSAFRHGYTKQDFYELLAADYLKIGVNAGSTRAMNCSEEI